MYENQEVYGQQNPAVTDTAGIAAYMTNVFKWMFMGLMLTAVTALLAATTMEELIWESGLWLVCIIVELVLVLVLSLGIKKMNPTFAMGMFCTYAIVSGLTFSIIFFAYEASSIISIFFVTAGIFGSLALIGYKTKKDLSGLGPWLLVGLIGAIFASIVTAFLPDAGLLDFAISIVGVIIFVGFTAYDTQKIKQYYYANTDNPTMLKRVAVIGALNLYLDFINLFLKLLRLLGKRK